MNAGSRKEYRRKEKNSYFIAISRFTLKDIQSIDYSWENINFEVHPMAKAKLFEENYLIGSPRSSYDIDIEPDDLEVSDTVTVVWESL